MYELTDKNDLSPWQKKLNEVIFGTETPAGKWFDIILLIVILISVVAVMLESVPEIRAKHGEFLHAIEWVVTIIFTVEFFLRLICIKKPFKYVFSFYGIIDILSTAPTYIGIFVSGTGSLKVLRSIRLLRIFRILKLGNFVKDSQKLINALRASRNKIIVFLFVVVMLVVILGTIMYLIEHGEAGFTSIPRSIYWAVVTLTTVGYGDIAPATPLGQFVASVIMILGYAIIAVPTGIVTNDLMQSSKKENLNNKACDSCGIAAHEADALFCKHCGGKL
jgi:voltage-gated potassium channel